MLHVVSQVHSRCERSTVVNADDHAVAGFFEDLPVLMFVLAGVASLLLSGSWVAGCEQHHRASEELRDIAEDFGGRLLDAVGASDPTSPAPMMASVEDLDVSAVSGALGRTVRASVSIVELYPDVVWVLTWRSEDQGEISSTGSFGALFHARGSDGNTAVMELRVVVWHSL